MDLIQQWLDLAVTAGLGASAFVCVFEGARRLRAYGMQRTAVLMLSAGAMFCLVYGGFSFWKHAALKDMAQVLERKAFDSELPADWGANLDPEQRRAASMTVARAAFVESGKLREYFELSGEKRRYLPTEEDIKSRDFAVATRTRLDDAIRANFGDALAWLIWGAVALAFGLSATRDVPLPGEAEKRAG